MYNPKIRNGHADLTFTDCRLAKADAAFIRGESIKESFTVALVGIAAAAPVVFAIIFFAFI